MCTKIIELRACATTASKMRIQWSVARIILLFVLVIFYGLHGQAQGTRCLLRTTHLRRYLSKLNLQLDLLSCAGESKRHC